MQDVPVALFHQQKDGYMVPRHLYIDYIDNFGNFSSCFALEKGQKEVTKQWQGGVDVQEQQQFELSNFHQELINYEIIEEVPAEMEVDPIQQMLASGKSARSIFEQMMPKQEQAQVQEEQIDTKPKAKDERTLEMYYRDCNFESQTQSFTDFMQPQLNKHHQMLLPHAIVAEPDFYFYSRGREMYKNCADFRDELEDKVRIQLEQSDLLQGFTLSADVSSGHGSLANILARDHFREESPKSPILLYACETQNQFKAEGSGRYKHDLFELNKALWLADLSRSVDMVVPFSDEKMASFKSEQVSRFDPDLLYHRTTLQGLVMNSIGSQLLPDANKKHHLSLGGVIQSVMYGASPNIVLPSL